MCDCESLEVITILALSGKPVYIHTHRYKQTAGPYAVTAENNKHFHTMHMDGSQGKPTGLPFYGWTIINLADLLFQHTRKLQKLAYFT